MVGTFRLLSTEVGVFGALKFFINLRFYISSGSFIHSMHVPGRFVFIDVEAIMHKTPLHVLRTDFAEHAGVPFKLEEINFEELEGGQPQLVVCRVRYGFNYPKKLYG